MKCVGFHNFFELVKVVVTLILGDDELGIRRTLQFSPFRIQDGGV